jgi:streptogramin lyase
MTTAGAVSTEFQLRHSGNNSMPRGIVAGIDGAIWFTDRTSGDVGRLAL